MNKSYGLLDFHSSEAQWIRFYKEQTPNATIREVAEVFRNKINPEGNIDDAERIVKVYLGLAPQESVDDLLPNRSENQ